MDFVLYVHTHLCVSAFGKLSLCCVRVCLLVGEKMSEEVVRQTRSQKRALEREAVPSEAELKRLKLEHSELATSADGLRLGSNVAVANAAKVSSLLKAGEVKATIKVELQTGDEPVDMSTTKR